MSALASIYLKKETLETLLKGVEQKGEKGITLTINISDQSNDYGQNVSAWVSQTKEQREANKPRFFTGNGKVFWTDGKITKAEKSETAPSSNNQQEPPF